MFASQEGGLLGPLNLDEEDDDQANDPQLTTCFTGRKNEGASGRLPKGRVGQRTRQRAECGTNTQPGTARQGGRHEGRDRVELNRMKARLMQEVINMYMARTG